MSRTFRNRTKYSDTELLTWHCYCGIWMAQCETKEEYIRYQVKIKSDFYDRERYLKYFRKAFNKADRRKAKTLLSQGKEPLNLDKQVKGKLKWTW